MEIAKKLIDDIVGEVEVGQIYKGRVTSIKNFGMFVRVLGQEGLCHISEVSHSRINNLEDLYRVGDTIEVIVVDIDQEEHRKNTVDIDLFIHTDAGDFISRIFRQTS